MNSPIPLHPVLVHFPVALLTFAFAAELWIYVSGRIHLSRIGWWTQVSGTLLMAFTVLTGLLAESQAALSASAQIHLDNHKQLAFVSAALFATLLLWRFATRTRIPPDYPRMYLALFALGTLMLWWTSWFGGELVFHFGVGVTPQ